MTKVVEIIICKYSQIFILNQRPKARALMNKLKTSICKINWIELQIHNKKIDYSGHECFYLYTLHRGNIHKSFTFVKKMNYSYTIKPSHGGDF